MALPYQPWRAALLPASFAGCQFHVEVGGQAGGRRNVTHEYPKRDVPFTEDMGRKARRWPVTGYVIGPGYIGPRDALIAACEAAGPATLVHPSLGSMTVNCDTYAVTETRERGGVCTFEMAFVEAGNLAGYGVTLDTQSLSNSAASVLGSVSAAAIDVALQAANGNISS